MKRQNQITGNRQKYLAGILAAAMLFGACSKGGNTKDSTREETSKKTVATSDEKPDASSDALSGDESPATSPSPATSDAPATDTDDPSATDPEFSELLGGPVEIKSRRDIYKIYESAEIRAMLPEELFLMYFTSSQPYTGLPDQEFDSATTITLDMQTGKFDGGYSRPGEAKEIDGGKESEYYMSEFSGQMDTFTRVDDHTFSAKVSSLEIQKFESYTQTVEGQNRTDVEHITYEDPEGFTNPDEMILYLPNTRKDEVPDGAIKQIKKFGTLTESEYLDQFILYNPAEETFFLISEGQISDTEPSSADALTDWYGDYYLLGGRMNIQYDDALDCVTASFVAEDEEQYKLFVEPVKNEPDCVMFYGSSARGATLVFYLWRFDDWYDVYISVYTGSSVNDYPETTIAIKI